MEVLDCSALIYWGRIGDVSSAVNADETSLHVLRSMEIIADTPRLIKGALSPLLLRWGKDRALHHAMNHVRFMISPELHVVQDRVQGLALNLTWFRGGGEMV